MNFDILMGTHVFDINNISTQQGIKRKINDTFLLMLLKHTEEASSSATL